MKKIFFSFALLSFLACDPFDSGRYYSLLVTVTDHTKGRYQVPVHIRKDEWSYSKTQMIVFDHNGIGSALFADNQTPSESFYVDVEVEGFSKRIFVSETESEMKIHFELYDNGNNNEP